MLNPTLFANKLSSENKDMSEFAARRTHVMKQLGKRDILILPSAQVAHRNGDVDYYYRQDSHFYYLTGFSEQQSVTVISLKSNEGKFVLFNLPKDPARETWTGRRAGQEGACKIYGADQAFKINDFQTKLPALLGNCQNIYFPVKNPHVDQNIKKILLDVIAQSNNHTQLLDAEPMLNEMRHIKSAAEIAKIRKAVEISEQGHLAAMRRCEPGVYEYQLESELRHEFLNSGAHEVSYPSIVGSGENTCILHYEDNERQIQDGDLVLVDAAAEYQNYAADITRTYPANGKFTQDQRAVYEIVLKAQKAAIDAVKPGETYTNISNLVRKMITRGLLDLGLLKGDFDELLKNKAYLPFYMHGVGHEVGLDVHDTNSNPDVLRAGMVLTMEPGIYISSAISDVPSRWHNIGVRIEDCLLVTESGCEVLSSHLPKEVDEIEQVMARSNQNKMMR